MLEITIDEQELFDNSIQEFITIKKQTLRLEHSLVSLSKWERKWHKPFFSKEEKTTEETIDYVRCMTLTQNVDPVIYTYGLSQKNLDEIDNYISDPATATTITDHGQKGRGRINGETVTAELIYYWMIAFNIPFECQKWHLNSLMTLIKVCSIKNSPAKKMSKNETAKYYAQINEARRKQFNTKG